MAKTPLEKEIKAHRKLLYTLEHFVATENKTIAKLERRRLLDALERSNEFEPVTDMNDLVVDQECIVVFPKDRGYLLGEVSRYINGEGKGYAIHGGGSNYTYMSHDGRELRTDEGNIVYAATVENPTLKGLGI